MITLTEDIGLTIPSVTENENKLLLSVMNWNEVGRSEELITFKSLLVYASI